MEQQLLRNSDIKPTDEVIAQALGSVNSAYAAFIKGLQEHDLEVEWHYYKDGKAWLGKGLYKWATSRGTLKEVTAFWLSIYESSFKVTIYIPEKVRAEALALPLEDEVKEMIESAKRIGKLKFFPVTFDLRTDKMFKDLYTLADFRKMVK